MKYKTKRERFKGVSIICLLIGIWGFSVAFLSILFYENETYIVQIGIGLHAALVGIGTFVYCWTYNVRRNRMKKYGEKFKARIIGAQCLFNARDEDTYYLLIAFYESGVQKIRYTEGYCGNPNLHLGSANCEIYKWKDKYIEANLDVLGKDEKPYNMKIPVTAYKFFKNKKGYV